MIGYLSGVLRAKQAQELLIDVQGVGYEVQVSLNTWFELPETGAPVALHTHFVVREDAQQLFGFGTLAERDLFRALIRIRSRATAGACGAVGDDGGRVRALRAGR